MLRSRVRQVLSLNVFPLLYCLCWSGCLLVCSGFTIRGFLRANGGSLCRFPERQPSHHLVSGFPASLQCASPRGGDCPRSQARSSSRRQILSLSSSPSNQEGGQEEDRSSVLTLNSTIGPLEEPQSPGAALRETEASSLQTEDPMDSLKQEGAPFSSSQDGISIETAKMDAMAELPPIRFLRDRMRKFLGMEPTADILAIVTIYFVEGAIGLAALAKTYLLKDELNLGPAELSALLGVFVLPWTIKPLYGFLSDGFPLFGYRRKSYLFAAGIVGALSYSLLGASFFWDGLPPNFALAGTVGALLLSSACIALSDVVADGIVVTKTRESANDPAVAGGLQSLCWGASATGSLLSAYFSGSLLQILPVRSIFACTAVLPLLVALIALQMTEEPVVATAPTDRDSSMDNTGNTIMDTVRDQTSALWEAFQQPSIWRPALFLFLWQSTPTADGAFFFFLTNDLGLGPEFMGRVRLVTSLATLAGVGLYNTYFKTVPIKDILKWSAVASFPLGLIPILLTTHVNRAWGIPDQALIYGDDVVLAMLGEIAFLPCLVLAARLCPPGVEAVLFATLMSIFNGASTVGTEIGAALTKLFGITENNFSNLTWLIILCNVTSLYPLLFIGFLDQIGDQSELELEQQEQENSSTTNEADKLSASSTK